VNHRYSKGAFAHFEEIPPHIRQSLWDKREKIGYGSRVKTRAEVT
jgi:hypothetical protein